MTDLFDWTPPPLLSPRPSVAFDGATYEPERDYKRLDKLIDRVFAFMSDGQWHTIPEVAEACGGTQTSVSARIRDLRKEQRGGHKVEAEHVHDGLWRYRLKGRG
jgi:hypothetical protein